MVAIGNNRFMDDFEVTNSDYLLYVYSDYFLQRQDETESHYDYVNDPNCYNLNLKRLPSDAGYDGWECMEEYWSHPAHMTSPLVGINLNNAIGYTQWREDRILEVVLVNNKLLDAEYVQKNPLTLRQFLAGEVSLNPTKKEWIAIPVLNLPSEEDMELAREKRAALTHNQSRMIRRQRRMSYAYQNSWWRKEVCEKVIGLSYKDDDQNPNGIFHLDDGADEFVLADQKRRDTLNVLEWSGENYLSSDGHGTRHTGFRCVAQYLIVRLADVPVKRR